jgi:hypothetical protein
MQGGAGKDRLICSSQEVHEPATRGTEGGQEIGEVAGVVVGLVGPTVRQVGRSELGIAREELLGAAQPQRLQVEKVPRVLLRRPVVIVTPRQNVFG